MGKEIYLPTEIINLIIQYLNYIDIVSLRIAVPTIELDYNKHFNKLLKHYMKRDGIKFIYDFIKKNNGNYCLSGGYLLGVITGEICPESDIDVYNMSDDGYFYGKPQDLTNPIQNELKNNNYLLKQFGNRYFELHVKSSIFEKENCITINQISVIKEHHVNIYAGNRLSHDTILKFIDKSFDLDICKVAYDGQRLYIKELDSIINRKCISQFIFHRYKQDHRFFYNTYNGHVTQYYSLIQRFKMRCEKYQSRGYDISIIDEIPFSGKICAISIKRNLCLIMEVEHGNIIIKNWYHYVNNEQINVTMNDVENDFNLTFVLVGEKLSDIKVEGCSIEKLYTILYAQKYPKYLLDNSFPLLIDSTYGRLMELITPSKDNNLFYTINSSEYGIVNTYAIIKNGITQNLLEDAYEEFFSELILRK